MRISRLTSSGAFTASKLNLSALEDDKNYFPLYNLTEVITSDLLATHPELIEIFGQLNPKLTNEVMLVTGHDSHSHPPQQEPRPTNRHPSWAASTTLWPLRKSRTRGGWPPAGSAPAP
jgi:hypothetical protein